MNSFESNYASHELRSFVPNLFKINWGKNAAHRTVDGSNLQPPISKLSLSNVSHQNLGHITFAPLRNHIIIEMVDRLLEMYCCLWQITCAQGNPDGHDCWRTDIVMIAIGNNDNVRRMSYVQSNKYYLLRNLRFMTKVLAFPGHCKVSIAFIISALQSHPS